MKKTILIIFLISIQCNLYSQTFIEQCEIITQVSKLFEKESVKLYYEIRNEHYEMEISLVKKNSSESNILKYLDLNYKDLIKTYRKTDGNSLSKYYDTITTKNLKEENIAILSIPIFSTDGKKAILYGRYFCGIFCGKINVFYFIKENTNWILSSIKEL